MVVSEEEHHDDLDWLAPQVLQSNFHWKTNKSLTLASQETWGLARPET